MPSPEHNQGGPPEDTPPKDREPSRYYQASRYPNERPAHKAYNQMQRVIYSSRDNVDLSVYRFLLNQQSHVAVIGEQPAEAVERRIERILSSGEKTALPAEILTLLYERRDVAKQAGPWVEGHYRPGIRVYPPEP